MKTSGRPGKIHFFVRMFVKRTTKRLKFLESLQHGQPKTKALLNMDAV